jgi:DNA-binding transcriptional LysR family regulator
MRRDVNFDIDLVRAFVAVAETRSFTQAAKRVHRTQSAVSMKIKRLEGQAGCQLFERDSTSVHLTATGERFLSTARRLIEISEEAYFTLNQDFAHGRLTIATSETYAAALLPGALSRFYDVFPHIEVEIRCGHTWALLDVLDSEKMDLAVATRSPKRNDGTRLKQERLLWVVSCDTRALDQEEVPLALFPDGCCYRQAGLAALREAGRPFRIAYTSASHDGLMAAVAAGRAVTVMIEGALSERVRVLGVEDGLPPLPAVDVVLYRGVAMSPAGRLFAETLESLFVDPDDDAGRKPLVGNAVNGASDTT